MRRGRGVDVRHYQATGFSLRMHHCLPMALRLGSPSCPPGRAFFWLLGHPRRGSHVGRDPIRSNAMIPPYANWFRTGVTRTPCAPRGPLSMRQRQHNRRRNRLETRGYCLQAPNSIPHFAESPALPSGSLCVLVAKRKTARASTTSQAGHRSGAGGRQCPARSVGNKAEAISGAGMSPSRPGTRWCWR